jgi:hypothetical protein
LDPTRNPIRGFTLEEFRGYFLEYLPDILEYNKSEGFTPPEADLDYLIGEIIGYYDGYSWDGETRVLNPYSLIQALATKELNAHWFSSGAMSFLIDFKKKEDRLILSPPPPQMSETSLEAVDLKNLKLTPLLFQTGYLTIDQRLSADSYLLRRPNQEVSQALEQNLLDYLLGQAEVNVTLLRERIVRALEIYDSTSLAASFRDILWWNSHSELKASEELYPGLIFSVLKALRFSVATQSVTVEEVFDILLTLGQRVAFVFEFKRSALTPTLGQSQEVAKKIKEKRQETIIEAKNQIQFRDYDAKYGAEYGVVKKVAVAFVGKTQRGRGGD